MFPLLAALAVVPNAALAAPLTSRTSSSRPVLLAARPPVMAAAVPPEPADGAQSHRGDNGCSPVALSASIIKNMIGIGIFSLCAGVPGTGLVWTLALLGGLGALAAWSFFLLGRAADETGSLNNAQLWQRTVGGSSRPLEIVMIVMAFGTCVQYSATLAQLLPAVAAPLFPLSRLGAILSVAAVLAPVCVAKDLNALRHTSYLGMGALVYSAGFVMWRALDGSYRAGGQYAAAAAAAVGSYNLWRVGPAALSLAGSMNTAYMTHFSVPRFASELRDSTPRRFGAVVAGSFLVAFALYCLVVACGYLTFGAGCKGLLLMNYAADDPGAQLVRAASAVSILTGYPLTFLALRDSTAALLNSGARRTAAGGGGAQPPADRRRCYNPATRARYGRAPVIRLGSSDDAGAADVVPRVPLSLGLLGLCTLTTLWAKDVAMIIALRGALFGSIVLYSFPALILLRSKRGRRGGRTAALHKGMLLYGLLAAAGSTFQCVRQMTA